MRLEFDSEHPFPGANGRLQWTLPGKIVPASLAVVRDGQSGIFIVSREDGETRAKFLPVPGAGPGQPLSVNIPEDTMVIVDGRYGLGDNDPVLIQ